MTRNLPPAAGASDRPGLPPRANAARCRAADVFPSGDIMPEPRILFGTDGWRGRIAEDYTFASVRRCTQGFARYLLETEGDGRPVIVGFDKRFGSEHFAAAAAEVLAGNGLR